MLFVINEVRKDIFFQKKEKKCIFFSNKLKMYQLLCFLVNTSILEKWKKNISVNFEKNMFFD